MYNHYKDFKKYRTELRRKCFYNDAYKQYDVFYRHMENIHHWSDLWDTTLFGHLSKNLYQIPLESFLNEETLNPTLNWTDLFEYNNALQKHPYFKEYLRIHTNDAYFWKTLDKYRNKLFRQIPNNNQQIWI